MNPIVDTYLELLAAPIGSQYFEFPYVFEMTPWGPVQTLVNTTFTAP